MMKAKKVKLIIAVVPLLSFCYLIYFYAMSLQAVNRVELTKIEEITIKDMKNADCWLLRGYQTYWYQITNLSDASFLYEDLTAVLGAYNFEEDGYIVVSWGRELASLTYQKVTHEKERSGYESFIGNIKFKYEEKSKKMFIYQMKTHEYVHLDSESIRASLNPLC